METQVSTLFGRKAGNILLRAWPPFLYSSPADEHIAIPSRLMSRLDHPMPSKYSQARRFIDFRLYTLPAQRPPKRRISNFFVSILVSTRACHSTSHSHKMHHICRKAGFDSQAKRWRIGHSTFGQLLGDWRRYA